MDALQEQAPKQDTRFKPGQSGNPAGRKPGTRNKLQTDFFKALSDDFAQNGKQALEDARTQNPAGYLKVVASLMPKEVEIKQPLGDITDEQLDATIIAVRAILAAQGAGDGETDPGELQPAESLQAVPEAG